MVHIVDIHRHPVKGWTPESLTRTRLDVGRGVPFDRHFAFTCGRLEDQPVPGQWVQPRTFLMLTFFPELASFQSQLGDDGVLHLRAPDGSSAEARVGDRENFGAADAFIQKHFQTGPYGAPRLVEQAEGTGHWDFSDTCVSIINLATVRLLEAAAGRPLERERFRGNLYIDGLEPWAEFDWPGRKVQVGDVTLEVLRPIQRCAMTSTEPGTGKRELDLPAIMEKVFGHKFCGVYARVTAAGVISQGDGLSCGSKRILQPYDHLPERVAPPELWPRFVHSSSGGHGLVRFTPVQADWNLLGGEAGQTLRLLSTAAKGKPDKAPIVEAGPEGVLCHVNSEVPAEGPILINGPFGRT